MTAKKGAIKFREVIIDRENDTAVVLEACSLNAKCKAKLESMGYYSGVTLWIIIPL
jgi:hypothetical protein